MSTESTTPCTSVEIATLLPPESLPVAVSVYVPFGHCVPSVPLPSQTKLALPWVNEKLPV